MADAVNDATRAPGPASSDTVRAEVCVVGGGMAGLCAALASARSGARTVLLQDRSVLGGNASSEVRMWICGAHGAGNRETGILEELMLENVWLNPERRYPLWDSVLYGKARYQERLQLVLGCAVTEVEMSGRRISAVRGWHLARQCWVRVEADLFADCSGDSVLRLSGAETRWGREGAGEFGESHAPPQPDRRTMGNSCLIQLREIDPARHRAFIPPTWAHSFPPDHPRLQHAKPAGDNFWWLEVGGELDTIADADGIRDELLRIAYGAWAFIKNHPDGRGARWELEWIGAVPGKRENVRYVGEHILTQGDIESCGVFPDLVCHGGWSMDDHHPAAFNHPGPPTIFHPAPSPYGIPLRCLYARSLENLFCAGRNASCTHMAMSSTRVMATCATMGQAIGTAAALAVRHRTGPQGVHALHLRELQNILLDDDQWLPNRRRSVPALTRAAELSASIGDPEPLRDGLDRADADAGHAWEAPPGATVSYRFAASAAPLRARVVGDSQLHRDKRMPCSETLGRSRAEMPSTLPRDLTIELQDARGSWRTAVEVRDNRRRLLQLPLAGEALAVRLTVRRAWGDGPARLFAFDIGAPDLAGAAADLLPWPATAIGRGGAA